MWPNFHWLQLATAGDTRSEPVGILNLRLEIPLSPTRTRMYSWFAIDKDASPADYRKLSYETYVRCFGPWRHLRPGRHGELGGVHRRGARPGGEALHAAPQDGPLPSRLTPDWAGPGTCLSPTATER